MNVLKRDGRLEALDISKVDKVLEWAAEDLNVSVSQVAMKAQLQFFDGMKTSDIHATLVNSAANLISEEEPDYQYMAARLRIFAIRKEVYGHYTPLHLLDHVESMVNRGLYDSHLLQDYTAEEYMALNEHINHERDLTYSYTAVAQLEGKYLVQDRTTKQLYETPQMLNMLIPMCLFSKSHNRMKKIVDYYNALSTFKISLPTPIMAGVRTPSRQFSSCVKIECDDSLDSINATSASIVNYVSQRAGIGINAGRIRALGSPIRDGEAVHTGMIPFLRLFQSSVKSCSQGGVRGGAATLFYPLWHLEVESLLVLKNNRGVEENRVRQLDYGVQINGLMYERLAKNENITLFSPHEVPALYDAYFGPVKEFKELYEKCEADQNLTKKVISARELFTSLAGERAQTGRIYIQHVDHCNTHTPFDWTKTPIRQSNLCLEIALPTQPVTQNGGGEIALCTLAAFNIGAISLKELPKLSELLVESLDNLLDYQNYPMPQARTSTMKYRPLGIGVINYANFLAKKGLTYSDSDSLEATHKLFEAIQFHLMKASVTLAKEKSPCEGFGDTLLSQGVLPIDTYQRKVDELGSFEYQMDWEGLRADIKMYGIRNATLTALMPSETSSQISNSTNGIEPPRDLVTVKQSKDGILRQVVPDVEDVAYETYWDMVRKSGNTGYLNLVAIMQKFVCQAISANTAYIPTVYPGNRVPVTLILQDMMRAYLLGIKTLYYHNTNDSETLEVDDCASGACKI